VLPGNSHINVTIIKLFFSNVLLEAIFRVLHVVVTYATNAVYGWHVFVTWKSFVSFFILLWAYTHMYIFPTPTYLETFMSLVYGRFIIAFCSMLVVSNFCTRVC